MNKQQISYLQQALWKLQVAQNLVVMALGDTDTGQLLTADIAGVMEDIESDLAESVTLSE